MLKAFAFLFLALPLAAGPLAACASAPLVPPDKTMLVAQSETGFELAYNTADSTYLAGLKNGAVTPARRALLKPLLQKWRKAILALRVAERLGDATELATQASAILELRKQVEALLKPGA
jgi:hypothetical protein